MEIPRVDPVGVVEYPEDFKGAPRRFSRLQRRLASALLAFFFLATVGTSTLSVGAYCLTSDGGDTRALRERLRQLKTSD